MHNQDLPSVFSMRKSSYNYVAGITRSSKYCLYRNFQKIQWAWRSSDVTAKGHPDDMASLIKYAADCSALIWHGVAWILIKELPNKGTGQNV